MVKALGGRLLGGKHSDHRMSVLSCCMCRDSARKPPGPVLAVPTLGPLHTVRRWGEGRRFSPEGWKRGLASL